jgi:hypothetical protein
VARALLKMRSMTKGLAVLVVLLSGCDLYFGGGDDSPPCLATGGAERDDGQRDPYTGECQWNYGCIDSCDCAYDDTKAVPPLADWGACYSQCSNLDEQTCFGAAGCYAAYIDNPAADGRQFWGCWQTAPSGPIRGQCANLDAYSCSRHDDCSAVYASSVNSNDTKFASCEPEQATFCIENTECGANAFCDHAVCYPSPTCTECPTCGACPDSNTCYGICSPNPSTACETLTTEMSCIARPDCAPVYQGGECTCTPNGCECQLLTYERCETP